MVLGRRDPSHPPIGGFRRASNDGFAQIGHQARRISLSPELGLAAPGGSVPQAWIGGPYQTLAAMIT